MPEFVVPHCWNDEGSGLGCGILLAVHYDARCVSKAWRRLRRPGLLVVVAAEKVVRVSRRVRLRPPRYGQDSGCLFVSGTRAMCGMGGDICGEGYVHRITHLTEIER